MLKRAPLRSLLPVLALSVGLACASGGDRTDGRGPTIDPPSESSAAVFPDTLPERLSRTLRGTIGERAVAVDIRLEDGRVGGGIRPVGPPSEERHRVPWLTGTVESDGSLALEVHDEGLIARIVGRMAVEDGRLVLEGERRPVDGDEIPTVRPVRLEERGVSLGWGARLVSRDVLLSDTARAIVFYAEAPRVVGPDGAPPADTSLRDLDAALGERIEAEREWFVESFGTTERDSTLERIVSERGPSWYESSYDAWVAAGSILNVEAAASTYGTGAAHPNHHTWTLVWDLESGIELGLADLFEPGSGWIDTLSVRAVTMLCRDLGEGCDDEWIRSGAGPREENFSAWTVVPDGLRVVFDPYQVASYAAGPQVVVVPWAALAPVLAADGPVATPEAVGLVSVPRRVDRFTKRRKSTWRTGH
ncbi:MAG: RsiV family protein [Gemmatimonadota bacterium]|nr:RsiV family protein [Gemmatimonadota bacterium]